jgi:hypothetical protein
VTNRQRFSVTVNGVGYEVDADDDRHAATKALRIHGMRGGTLVQQSTVGRTTLFHCYSHPEGCVVVEVTR